MFCFLTLLVFKISLNNFVGVFLPGHNSDKRHPVIGARPLGPFQPHRRQVHPPETDACDGGQVWPDCLIRPQEDQEEPDPERDGHGQPQAQPKVMLGVRGGHHGPSSPHNHSHQIPGNFLKSLLAFAARNVT